MHDDFTMNVYGWMVKVTNSPNELLVLALIYAYHEKGIECKFSYIDLAISLNMSKSSAQLSIKKLTDKGIIKVDSNFDENGGNLPNTYRFVSKGVKL